MCIFSYIAHLKGLKWEYEGVMSVPQAKEWQGYAGYSIYIIYSMGFDPTNKSPY